MQESSIKTKKMSTELELLMMIDGGYWNNTVDGELGSRAKAGEQIFDVAEAAKAEDKKRRPAPGVQDRPAPEKAVHPGVQLKAAKEE